MPGIYMFPASEIFKKKIKYNLVRYVDFLNHSLMIYLQAMKAKLILYI